MFFIINIVIALTLNHRPKATMVSLQTMFSCLTKILKKTCALYGPVRLSYKLYFFSQRTMFFSNNESANNTFSQTNRDIHVHLVAHQKKHVTLYVWNVMAKV
jgi:hypothetical protein